MYDTVKHRSAISRAARAFISGGLIAGGLFFGSAAHAGLTFTFDYSDNAAGVGFEEAGQIGLDRKAALVTAGNLFSNMFGSFFSNSANIVLKATSSITPLPGPLASAGTEYGFLPGFGNSEVVRNKILTGNDLNAGAADGSVNVNFGAEWELDPNTPAVVPGPGQTFDFFAALFHEFTHALGFASILREDGTDLDFNGTSMVDGGTGVAGNWSKYDQFLTNCSGSPLINAGTGLTNKAVYDPAATSAVCFDGANALAANGGNAVEMFTPNPYQPGSSVSHLDGGPGNFPNAMMKFDRDYGPQEARVYNAVEVGILTDLGYIRNLVNAVPEPGSLALVLGALAGAGYVRRRKV